MTEVDQDRLFWRVGDYRNPLEPAPPDMYAWNNRFDDIRGRFRTLYCADLRETALRELLADFRPNLEAQQRYIAKYGPEAAADIPSETVTKEWRCQHVLVPVTVQLSGWLEDLSSAETRRKIEAVHTALLQEYGLEHLDLHEITTRQRPVTQTIAGHLFDAGAAGVYFQSSRDGCACIALFEGRGSLVEAGDRILLIDPPPGVLTDVAAEWGLTMEAAPREACDEDPLGTSA